MLFHAIYFNWILSRDMVLILLSCSKLFSPSSSPSSSLLMKTQAQSQQDTDLPSLEEDPVPPLLNIISPRNSSVL
jgi:hypothetical protein